MPIGIGTALAVAGAVAGAGAIGGSLISSHAVGQAS